VPFMPGRTALLVASFLAGLSLLGCTRMDEDQNGIDPPALNPSPVERVTLHVVAPTTLNVRLVAVYQIGIWLGLMGGGGTYCGPESDRQPQPGSTRPVHGRASTEVPIELKWDGHEFAGEFFIDRFSPGRCDWGFARLSTSSPAKDSVSLFFERATNYNFDTTHSHGVYDQSPIQSADLWCAPDPSTAPAEHGKMLCTSLEYFQKAPGVVDPRLPARVPKEQREHVPSVNIFPFTKEITLRFHDLEAENRAAALGTGQ
jgi:hypothetical protein